MTYFDAQSVGDVNGVPLEIYMFGESAMYSYVRYYGNCGCG